MTLAGLGMSDIIKAIGGRVLFGKCDETVGGISIDSRKIAPGELFVAIRGARFDGHDYVDKALKTASGAIVSIPPVMPPNGKCVIHVQSTLSALHDLANFLRKKYNPMVFGITGTNGKTTTKEMASSVLGAKFNVLKNTGNLNNQIGLPLSIMELNATHEAMVLEMGASMPGDIRELCRIAEPNFGVLTNIGQAHLEGFGDMQRLRKTKAELLDFVETVAVNADDDFLMEAVAGYTGRVVRFGLAEGCDVRATEIEHGDAQSTFTLTMNGQSERITINMPGIFNVYNALAASALAHMAGLGVTEVAAGLKDFKGVPMRVEHKRLQGALVISDVYNANPSSMEEALKELIRMRGTRSIAVLGDMLELGDYSEAAHRDMGKFMSRLGVDVFIAVGPNMAHAADEFEAGGKAAYRADDAYQARSILMGLCGENDTVLVKGSRSMSMEHVVEGDTNGKAEVSR